MYVHLLPLSKLTSNYIYKCDILLNYNSYFEKRGKELEII